MKRLSFTLMLLILLVGCGTTCLEQTKGLSQANFYSSTTKSALSIDTLTIKGVGMDSALYKNALKITLAYLALKMDTGYTAYQINYKGTIDIVEIWHQNRVQFISNECGCATHRTIDSVKTTHNLLDSITIKNPNINGDIVHNLSLWFKTRP